MKYLDFEFNVNPASLTVDEYMDVIVCGMNYPERPIKSINTKYRKIKEKLNIGRKSFEDIYTDIDVDDDLDNEA